MVSTKKDLRELFLFSGLTDEVYDVVYQQITANAKEKIVEKGEVLYTPEEPCGHMMVILQGMVKSIWYSNAGEGLASNYFRAPCIVLVIPCLSQTRLRSYYVADMQSRLLFVPRADLVAAMDQNAAFKDQIIRHLCNISEQRLSHLYIIQRKRATHRICSYLLEEYRFEGRLQVDNFYSFESLANYLNLTRPAFSKALHELERQGLLTVSRRCITINDLERMREMVEP